VPGFCIISALYFQHKIISVVVGNENQHQKCMLKDTA